MQHIVFGKSGKLVSDYQVEETYQVLKNERVVHISNSMLLTRFRVGVHEKDIPNFKISIEGCDGGHICGITRDILELRNEVNNFNNTLKRITDNNYFFKIENLDVSKIVNIYLRQPNDLKYTVWVGGTEVVDHYVSLEEANRIANEYKEKGYDDVQVEIKE